MPRGRASRRVVETLLVEEGAMQVEAAAALAPVLARFAIVVDGPAEAEVLSRIVAGGDRATTLAELARPFSARPGLSRPASVAVVRTLVARLVASGTVEHVGGGYRIADPALATTLQHVVEAVMAASPPPPGATAVPTAATVPVAVEEASRLLQQALGARWAAPPAPVSAVPTPAGAPTSEAAAPAAWAPLLNAGWTAGPEHHDLQAPVAVIQSGTAGARAPSVRFVVADPAGPAAGLAIRLGTAGPVSLAHVAASPVRWGQGDPMAARATADGLAAALASPRGRAAAPVVLDRGLVPALAVLAHEGSLPRVVVVDLRSLPTRPVAAPPTPATPTSSSTNIAAAMAGAAGVAAPARRLQGRRHAGRGPATLLEVLFGPRFAAGIVDEHDGQGEGTGAGGGDATAGVVVTARTDDPQADALGELLGVEVVHLRSGDDLAPEVLAWLEDEDRRVLLAPHV